MESIFGLIMFFVFMFIASKATSAKKKNAQNATTQTDPIKPIPTTLPPMPGKLSVVPPVIHPNATESDKNAAAGTLGMSAIEAELKQREAQVKKHEASKALLQARLKKASHLKSGESVTDEAGCIGGSLGAHAEEGEHPSEHAQHLKARDDALAAESTQAGELRNISVQELRKAVIVSEILDKPLALRRRR